jgi:Uma2 family endonuclease
LLLQPTSSSPIKISFNQTCSSLRKRYNKRNTYQRYRVPDYWIVDLDACIVERWRPDETRPEMLSQQLTWKPSDPLPLLEIDLPPYFSRVFRE